MGKDIKMAMAVCITSFFINTIKVSSMVAPHTFLMPICFLFWFAMNRDSPNRPISAVIMVKRKNNLIREKVEI